VNFSDPVGSPLGEDRPFLLSYTGAEPAVDPVTLVPNSAYYEPFTNPNLDMIDIHKGIQNEWDVRAGFDDAVRFRETYLNAMSGDKKPFHQGEYSTYAHKDIMIGTETIDHETYPYFANYNVSFHNELWASTFYGSFAAGTTWTWDRVFWWEDALKPPLFDANNFEQTVDFTNVLGQPNNMDLGLGFPITVHNRRVHHHFKPLSDLLNKPNWLAFDFLNGSFSAHRHTKEGEVPWGTSDEERGIECYWLLREPDHDLAIGWVHNMNAYWDNSWYMRRFDQELYDCTTPNAQTIMLPGFEVGNTYYVSYFPTWMNSTIRPADDEDDDADDTVVLDLQSAPLSGTVGTPLDTLHSDYAFIIATSLVKQRQLQAASDTVSISEGWEFSLYPNPTRDELNLVLPDDTPRDAFLHDLSGRQIEAWRNVKGPVQRLPINQLAKGAYLVRVNCDGSSRTKKLIIH